MQLLFSREKSVKGLNADFQKLFPFLKLEFFSSEYLPGQTSLWDEKLPEGTLFGNVIDNLQSTTIEFLASDSTASFEQQIQNKTGMTTRVIRKVSNEWIETRNMNHLSLDYLNALGATTFRYNSNYHTLYL